MPVSVFSRVWICTTVIVALAGCGNSDPYHRQPVSGTVLLDGHPLPAGAIVFVPDPAGPVVSGARVENGRFYVPQVQGLPVGIYKVSVTASVAEGTVSQDPEELLVNPPSERSLIPPQYNTKTKLLAIVRDASENDFSFDLTSK